MHGDRLRELLRSIAANVRRLRQQRGLTQERLAEGADIDLSYLQRVERAEANLTVGVLDELAHALGVAPARLLRTARLPPLRRGRPPKRAAGARGATRRPARA